MSSGSIDRHVSLLQVRQNPHSCGRVAPHIGSIALTCLRATVLSVSIGELEQPLCQMNIQCACRNSLVTQRVGKSRRFQPAVSTFQARTVPDVSTTSRPTNQKSNDHTLYHRRQGGFRRAVSRFLKLQELYFKNNSVFRREFLYRESLSEGNQASSFLLVG